MTSQTPKEENEVKWEPNDTNASRKQCVINNLEERNFNRSWFRFSKTFLGKVT